MSLKEAFIEVLPHGKSMSVTIRDIMIDYVLDRQKELTKNNIKTSQQSGDNTQNNQNTYITNNYYGDSDQGKDKTE